LEIPLELTWRVIGGVVVRGDHQSDVLHTVLPALQALWVELRDLGQCGCGDPGARRVEKTPVEAVPDRGVAAEGLSGVPEELRGSGGDHQGGHQLVVGRSASEIGGDVVGDRCNGSRTQRRGLPHGSLDGFQDGAGAVQGIGWLPRGACAHHRDQRVHPHRGRIDDLAVLVAHLDRDRQHWQPPR
jgi:hypothetical protein